MYQRPYARIAPYVVGVLTGFFMWKSDRKVRMPKVSNPVPFSPSSLSFSFSLSLSLSLSLSPNIYRYIVLIDVLIDIRIIHKSKGILISFINVLFVEHNLLLLGRGEFDCGREQLLSPVLSCIHLHVVVYHLKCLLLNYYDVA